MPLTIEVFIPNSETQATLTAITGTGTAANPYTITQSGSSQFGTISVLDAANLLGLWQVKVGTRAIHRVNVVAGTTNYPLPEYATKQDIDLIDAGAIEGAHEVALTVTDSVSDDAIEGAVVRYYRTGSAGGGSVETYDDGEAIVGLDAATWKWIASAAGYETQTGTLVVSADRTHAIELVASTIDVADAPYCNVTLPAISQFTEDAADIPCEIDFLGFLSGATRTAIVLNLPPDLVTGTDGTITVRLARLAKYRATYKIPIDAFVFEKKVIDFSTPNAGSFTVVEPAG